MLRTSYHIEKKIDLALSLSEANKQDNSLLKELKNKIAQYNEYPGSEREAIKKLFTIGNLLIKAIYPKFEISTFNNELKSTEKELFKKNPELIFQPDSKALIELISYEKACFNFIKSKQPIIQSLLSFFHDVSYGGLFSKEQMFLKKAFEILCYLLISNIKKQLKSNKDKKGPQLLKNIEVTVILPMRQRLDYRLSDGGCIGYSMVFLHSMLQKKLPFGIKSLDNLPYNYISHYILVNHLAYCNMQIINSYIVYNSRNVKRIAEFNKENSVVLTKHEQFTAKAKSTDNIRSELIQKIDQTIDEIKTKQNMGIHVGLTSKKNGHSWAFYPNQEGIHFVDANIGWLYFKKQENLIQFLDRLLKLYETCKYSCIDISYYNPTQNTKEKSIDVKVEAKQAKKIYTPLSSTVSLVTGMLDMSANEFKTTLIAAKNNFCKGKMNRK